MKGDLVTTEPPDARLAVLRLPLDELVYDSDGD